MSRTFQDYWRYGDISGYLSCPCHLEGSLFTRVGATEDSVPDVEIRLLNTLIGNSPETMSEFVRISNIDVKVAIVLITTVDHTQSSMCWWGLGRSTPPVVMMTRSPQFFFYSLHPDHISMQQPIQWQWNTSVPARGLITTSVHFLKASLQFLELQLTQSYHLSIVL